MKKTIIILFLCLLFTGIPLTSAISVEKVSFIKDISKDHTISTLEDIPEWAIGNYTAVWGLNILGEPQEPLGLVLGYYGTNLFAGLVTNTTAPNGWIWGYRFSIFMIGIVANLDGEQKVPFIGIGLWNEEGFYYRIMSIFGPTIYIAGTYTPF